jgi:hypothetical protein
MLWLATHLLAVFTLYEALENAIAASDESILSRTLSRFKREWDLMAIAVCI